MIICGCLVHIVGPTCTSNLLNTTDILIQGADVLALKHFERTDSMDVLGSILSSFPRQISPCTGLGLENIIHMRTIFASNARPLKKGRILGETPLTVKAPRIEPLEMEASVEAGEAAGVMAALAELNVFRTLLRHPPLAKVLNDLLLMLLGNGNKLSHRAREIIIMRCGWVTASNSSRRRVWYAGGVCRRPRANGSPGPNFKPCSETMPDGPAGHGCRR